MLGENLCWLISQTCLQTSVFAGISSTLFYKKEKKMKKIVLGTLLIYINTSEFLRTLQKCEKHSCLVFFKIRACLYNSLVVSSLVSLKNHYSRNRFPHQSKVLLPRHFVVRGKYIYIMIMQETIPKYQTLV